MDLRDLVNALMNADALTARQWVADAAAAHVQWSAIPQPHGLNTSELAVAAGVVEMMAMRMGVSPPSWTSRVPPSPQTILLVPSLATMPRFRRYCEAHCPEPLRRRNILAPPEFLTAA